MGEDLCGVGGGELLKVTIAQVCQREMVRYQP
jgi:hypothetical protein